MAPRWSGEDLADKARVLRKITGPFGEMSIRFYDINPSNSPLDSLEKASASCATVQNHNHSLSLRRHAPTGEHLHYNNQKVAMAKSYSRTLATLSHLTIFAHPSPNKEYLSDFNEDGAVVFIGLNIQLMFTDLVTEARNRPWRPHARQSCDAVTWLIICT